MARFVLLTGVVACLVIGAFAATAPAPVTAPLPPGCSSDFVANLNSVSPDISTFTQLYSALNIGTSTSAVTIFAPSNGAFQAAVGKLGISANPGEWTAAQKLIVSELIKYHFAPGVQQKTSDLTQFGASFKSAANNLALCKADLDKQDKDNSDNVNAVTMLKDGKTYSVKAGFNAATITKPDLNSTCLQQVVVHVIDTVLLPCSVDVIEAAAKALATPAAGTTETTNTTTVTKATNTTTKATPIVDTVAETTNTTTATKPTNTTTEATTVVDPVDETANATTTDTNVTTKPVTSAACKLGTVAEIVLNTTKDTAAGEISALVDTPTFEGTVFVPSEDALRIARDLLAKAAANSTDNALSEAINVIKNELNMYHIVPNEIIEANVTTETSLVTELAGMTKQVFCPVAAAGKITVIPGDANLVVKSPGATANIISSTQACNGVVHKVDALLLPCSIAKSILGAALGTETGPTPPGVVADNSTDTTTDPTTDATTGTTAGASKNTTTSRGVNVTTTGTPTFVPGNSTISTSGNATALDKTVKDVKSAQSAAAAAVASAMMVVGGAMAAMLL